MTTPIESKNTPSKGRNTTFEDANSFEPQVKKKLFAQKEQKEDDKMKTALFPRINLN